MKKENLWDEEKYTGYDYEDYYKEVGQAFWTLISKISEKQEESQE